MLYPNQTLRHLIRYILPGVTLSNNTGSFIDYKALLSRLPPKTIVCRLLRNRLIFRCPESGEINGKSCKKYSVSSDTLPGRSKYPDFCAGFFIAITADLMPRFQAMLAKEKPFWIDDSYLGVLQELVGTKNINSKRLVFVERGDIREKLRTGSVLAVHLGTKYSESMRTLFPIDTYS